MSPIEILQNALVGQFISYYSIGDNWTLNIGNYYLLAQNIISKDEKNVQEAIENSLRNTKYTVDKAEISKSAIIAANMRKTITNIHLDKDYNLSLEISSGSDLFIPTNESIVDWQWALNKSGGDPYCEKNIIACFFTGEITI